MRIGWHIPLPGPFSVGGTLWRSKPRRRRGYHGTLPGWKCPHYHSRPDLAEACAQREARRRGIPARTAPATPRQGGKASAQVQRAVAAGKAANDAIKAMIAVQAAGGTAQAHYAAAQAAMQTAIAELQTLVRHDPGNAAIPELAEALKSMLGVLEGRTTDAAPGQETTQ